MLDRITDLYHNLPDKKKYIDLVTAALTIPVLISVIVTNLGNLNHNKNKDIVSAQVPKPTVERIIIKETESPKPTFEKKETEITITPTPTIKCDTNLPTFEIISPVENEKISNDPTCVTLNQIDKGNYCSFLHAYRVNDNSSWSTFSDEPICLYNMASGNIKLEIKIKSISTGTEKTYSRNFTYLNKSTQNQISPSIQPTGTPIPTL